LLARVQGRGIYQSDVDRKVAEAHYLAGVDYAGETNVERQSALTDLIANAAARSRARLEKTLWTEWKHERDVLQWQFKNATMWYGALQGSRLNDPSLSRILREDLCARQWISKQIAPEIDVTEDECRRFYDSHPENFFVPEHLHVSHLFLAAPPETAPEVVEGKRTVIEALSVRLAVGEDFATLAAENSEDEATKLRGGDLGYFSATRMPPDCVEAAVKLRPGEISKPIRTRLGFHILKLIDVQPARQKAFDEAHNDIVIGLANQKRASAVQNLIVDLTSQADYQRPL
jgi:parvulin-like peptidyl-prolyl isomerase